MASIGELFIVSACIQYHIRGCKYHTPQGAQQDKQHAAA